MRRDDWDELKESWPALGILASILLLAVAVTLGL
jgi:hypothetical protein